jgi:glycosyltransferase involved in cell wall biosynthesis
LLIGVGSLLEKTKEQVQQLGIEKNVHFLGERKDVNLLLQAIDCFLMPSTFEGQPFVLIEAQCAGVPCLVSDAINEDICLTDNVVRYQLARSSNDWASEMERLLDNFQRKDESSTIAEKGYSIKSVITYLEKVYGAEDSFK